MKNKLKCLFTVLVNLLATINVFGIIDFNHSLKTEISFLENKGQWPGEILFQSEASATNIYLLKDGLSFAQRKPISNGLSNHSMLVWNMRYLNSNQNIHVEGEDGTASKFNYISGNDPSKWINKPLSFKKITYYQIYDQIDLIYYGNENQLEYDFVIHPGGSVNSLCTSYEGIENLTVNVNGDLEVSTLWNKQIQKAPIAWQTINGEKVFVPLTYILKNDSTFGFAVVGKYNNEVDLVIDPLFQMVWSSYTQIPGGSNNINYCFSNAMDLQGNVYLTGMVDNSFPITPGAYSGPGNVQPEVFVAKFSSDGSTLIYWTYLPGSSSEFGVGIAVDSLGRAYITGTVDLNITGITNFPSTPTSYQPVHNTGSDAFLTVLNASGSALVYSTFLGGSGSETGYDIALGPNGIAYVVGQTSIGNFPLKASPVFSSGDKDAFVAKFDINQTGNNSLIYSTRLGAGPFSQTSGRSIAVNNAGNAFITGSIGTSFGTPSFPTTVGAYANIYNPGQDGGMSYVTKISTSIPITLSYSTLLAPGLANGIAVDKITGEAFITGTTQTATFPITPGALQQTLAGNGPTDAFAVKLNATGSNLIYSTFIGGPNWDNGTSIVTNSIGEAYVTGLAELNFPTSFGCIQPSFAGGWKDFFVVHINASGSGYGCGGSTYVGGSDADYTGAFYDYPAPQISLRDYGGFNDSISLSATSHSQDFPTTPGVYGPVKVNGIADQPVFFKMTCASIAVTPQAGFTALVSSSCENTVVNFTDSSLNNPQSWQWSFPGAIPSFSTQQHPQNIQYTSSGLYQVDLIVCNSAGCDTFSTTLQISVPQQAFVNLGNDTSVCFGNNLFVYADSGYANYSWQLNGSNLGFNGDSISANQPGNYSVVVTNLDGCTASDTLQVSIVNIAVSLGPDLVLCNNDTSILFATPGFLQYLWYLNDTLQPISSNQYSINASGNYIVSITDSNGCSARDTVIVVESTVSVQLGNDTAFCEGNSLLLNPGIGFSNYQWLMNDSIYSSASTIQANQSGNYSVLVTNQDGCTAADSLLLLIHSLPLVSTVGDTALCLGQNLLLNTTGALNYSWSPSTYLSSSTIQNPICTPTSTISYSVTGTDINGCTASAQVVVDILPLPISDFDFEVSINCRGIELVTVNQSINATEYHWNFGDGTSSQEQNPLHYYSSLQNLTIQLIAINGSCRDTLTESGVYFDIPILDSIPNIFTPNGDNVNDCFSLSGLENYDDCFSLKIFNRWGAQVYEVNDKYECWNGKSQKGEILPDGVYYYLLSVANTKKQGIVHLMK
jgi:gliding motility-associated-like protein